MTIVTKTGDGGQTGLLSGERVSKTDLRVEAYGTLDELVSQLGFARAFQPTKETNTLLKKIQTELFRLGAELAATSLPKQWNIQPMGEKDIVFLEENIYPLEKKAKLPHSFVLPGNMPVSAALDVARTTCRRLERRMMGLIEAKLFSNQAALRYVNRLSDFLFIVARHEQLQAGQPLEPVGGSS